VSGGQLHAPVALPQLDRAGPEESLDAVAGKFLPVPGIKARSSSL